MSKLALIFKFVAEILPTILEAIFGKRKKPKPPAPGDGSGETNSPATTTLARKQNRS